ncbi:hypothetical protein WA1_35635 [Scytonema hofmannii PCC 7110]|uniref:DUF4351 domain-containing protein n=1 Tax=Scytonema hofmannii PCC 7110 TaxID=128403 RepID=A0A139X1J1_9CYAN|nr:DUF4351 domain-containing protein [Scytonema hofmannii]KYC38523.1 hypothetical protein WA1_35635 [Scytonema hofmannii PCC 7110]
MAYDNTCKYLAETYPAEFARWLLQSDTSDIQVLKTELNLEPIRADSVTFLQVAKTILHLEFQTLPKSKVPLDFRMLDYYTRLKRLYRCEIKQIIIFLQQTTSETVFQTQYVDTNTVHNYRVIRIWEEDPAVLVAHPGLLPLAPLAKSNSPNTLLKQVAASVDMIEETQQQQNISACVQLLAGLRFDENLIQQFFSEEVMQESVIYQSIVQKEALRLIVRLLNRRFGDVAPEIEQRIRSLSTAELENLGEALLDFSNTHDLITWLETSS